MDGNFLGKITAAEFGMNPGHPFLMGLQLQFKFDGNSCVTDGGRHTINVSEGCRWESEEQKNAAFKEVLIELNHILVSAKVNHVSQLIGKPIEITIEHNQYKSFRILTEVL